MGMGLLMGTAQPWKMEGAGEVSKCCRLLREVRTAFMPLPAGIKCQLVIWPSELSAAKTWLTEEAAGLRSLPSLRQKMRIT